MTRVKKTRGAGNGLIFDDTITPKSERYADPDSYESRKKRANAKKKRGRSIYQKTVEEERANKGDNVKGQGGEQTRKLGPLAEKIRRLNEAKKQKEDAEAAKED